MIVLRMCVIWNSYNQYSTHFLRGPLHVLRMTLVWRRKLGKLGLLHLDSSARIFQLCQPKLRAHAYKHYIPVVGGGGVVGHITSSTGTMRAKKQQWEEQKINLCGSSQVEQNVNCIHFPRSTHHTCPHRVFVLI